MGRDAEYPLSSELEENLTKLLVALNMFRARYGKPMYVTSGYRPGKYNGIGAKRSAHLTCQAADFQDADGSLKKFCQENISLLEECDLYMEHPSNTPTWCHLQIRPTRNRIFYA